MSSTWWICIRIKRSRRSMAQLAARSFSGEASSRWFGIQLKLRDGSCQEFFHAFKGGLFLSWRAEREATNVGPALENSRAYQLLGHPPHPLQPQGAVAKRVIGHIPIDINAPLCRASP